MNRRVVTQIGPLPPPYGGVCVHVIRLCRLLEAQGWEVTRAVSGRSESARARVQLANSPLLHLTASWRVPRGIIHLHDRLIPLSAAVAIGNAFRRLPMVYTLHGLPVNANTGKVGVGSLLRIVLSRADHVIAVSSQVANMLTGHRTADQISVLPAYLPPPPEDLESLDPRAQSWLERSPNQAPLMVLMVTRLLPPKRGYQDVYGLAATADAMERLGDGAGPLRLAVLLAQPPQNQRERDYLATHEGRLRKTLGDRLGMFSEIYGPPLLTRARVLLRPTLTDGDAVSVREALDLGCAVIASDVAPRPSGCVLYPGGNTEALCDAIRVVLEGRPGPERRETNANPIESYERIYRSLT